MATQIDIVNYALIKLGQEPISDLSEDNVQARTMSAIYDIERRSLLRSYNWGFAIGRAQLASLDSYPLFDYAYAYQLPSDFIRLVRIMSGYSVLYLDTYNVDPIPGYVIEGKTILTNISSPLYIQYIKDIRDESFFDSAFVKAFSCALAVEACEKITNSTNLKESCKLDFQRSISLAVRAHAIEKPPVSKSTPANIMVRL